MIQNDVPRRAPIMPKNVARSPAGGVLFLAFNGEAGKYSKFTISEPSTTVVNIYSFVYLFAKNYCPFGTFDMLRLLKYCFSGFIVFAYLS